MSQLPSILDNIPEYLRQGFDDSAVSNLLRGPSIDRISIRGRVWRLIEGGQEIGQNGSPELEVVLVAAAPKISRKYFAGGFDPNKKELPTCWSSDGETPDAQVPANQKRCSNCAQCPMNVAGSANHGDSRACKFEQRIAVALPDRLNKVYAMTMPSTSIWGDKVAAGAPAPLSQYAQFLASQRLPMEGVVTAMSFDLNETQPTVRFRASRWLSQEQMHVAKQLGTSPEALAAITVNVAQREGTALPAPTQPISAPAQTMSAPVQQQAIQQAPVMPQPVVQQGFQQPQQPVVQQGFQQPVVQQPLSPQVAPAGFGQQAPQQPLSGDQIPFHQPAQEAAPAKGRRRKADTTAAPTGFSAPAGQATGFSQPAQGGFTAPAGFSAPQGFSQPAQTEQPAPAGFSEPLVISPADAAARTNTPEANIQSLLEQWAVK